MPPIIETDVFTDVIVTHKRGTPREHAKLRRRSTPTEGSSTMSPSKPRRNIDTGSGDAHGCREGNNEVAPTGAADVVPEGRGDCVKEGAGARGLLPGVNDGVTVDVGDGLLSMALALVTLVAVTGIVTVKVAEADLDEVCDGNGIVVVLMDMLCVSESVPLGENACEAVNDGVLDSDEPRELVTDTVGKAAITPVTDAVSVKDSVQLTVGVPEAELPCVPDPL